MADSEEQQLGTSVEQGLNVLGRGAEQQRGELCPSSSSHPTLDLNSPSKQCHVADPAPGVCHA